MVNKCVLDTDTLTAFFREDAAVVRQATAYLKHYDKLTISIVTYYEVLRGLSYVNATRQLKVLEEFIETNEVLALDMASIRCSADVYKQLRRHGELIGEADMLIAGIAIANGYTLATNNTRHFSRVQGLGIVNWLKSDEGKDKGGKTSDKSQQGSAQLPAKTQDGTSGQR